MESPAAVLDSGSGSASEIPQPIVLFDGTCGLCDRSVRWLMRRDGGALYFAPLQGNTTRALGLRFALPATLESVVLVDGDRVFVRSKAFLHVARYLRRPWRWAYALRWLPAVPLDLGYRLVARLRYRLFGRVTKCTVPTPADLSRLLP